LALALAHNPEVIILDEPTAGLDVQGRAQLHDAIRELKTNGLTVLLATHDMAEAEALCDRMPENCFHTLGFGFSRVR